MKQSIVAGITGVAECGDLLAKDRPVKDGGGSDKGDLKGSRKQHSKADSVTGVPDNKAKTNDVGDPNAPGKGVGYGESMANRMTGIITEAQSEEDFINGICGKCECGGESGKLLRKGLAAVSKQALKKIYNACCAEEGSEGSESKESGKCSKCDTEPCKCEKAEKKAEKKEEKSEKADDFSET